MPLVTIYPLSSSLPQPSLGCSRPSAHPPPGRISGRGQGPAEHCWSGLGLKLFPPSPEVQLACPQARGQLPCLTMHTTEPKPSTALPIPPSFTSCHPRADFSSLPPSRPLFQRHFPPWCQMAAEEREDSEAQLPCPSLLQPPPIPGRAASP